MRILLTNDDGIYAPGLRALRKELQKLGEVVVVAPATEQSAAGHSITLLTPPDPPITHSRSDVNANSVIVRLDYGAVGVLFAADAEPQTERWLLTSGARLPAQILKVAHHGGRYSSTPRFLSAVSPLAAVISVGEVNEYGHPTPQAIGRLERAHARVFPLCARALFPPDRRSSG